jgi:hypothetical protein
MMGGRHAQIRKNLAAAKRQVAAKYSLAKVLGAYRKAVTAVLEQRAATDALCGVVASARRDSRAHPCVLHRATTVPCRGAHRRARDRYDIYAGAVDGGKLARCEVLTMAGGLLTLAEGWSGSALDRARGEGIAAHFQRVADLARGFANDVLEGRLAAAAAEEGQLEAEGQPMDTC